MTIIKRFLLASLSVMLMHSVGLAHPGHGFRKKPVPQVPATAVANPSSVSQTGVSPLERGTLVMARDGLVQIRNADDTLEVIPMSQLSRDEQESVQLRLAQIRAELGVPLLLAQNRSSGNTVSKAAKPAIAEHFDPFVKLKGVQTRWDEKFLYIESKGIPAHQMMVGITAWQQQVPIPQKYFGENAWRVPLHPVPAKKPATTKNRFLRGAIAIAVNGIPIFNPLNNRGDDAYLFGELDEFGGHCGRADDYHYHLAPVHLQTTVGKEQPIAYALDGYPIYGYQDPQAPDFAPLDTLNGHKDNKGQYHYHATRTYPYLNGGFYGEVVEKEGQVDPQPRAEPLRPSLTPLRDAKITNFEELQPGKFRLTYNVLGKSGTVNYTLHENGSADFEFVDPAGRKTTETYTPRRQGGRERRPPPRPDENPPRRGNRPRRRNEPPQNRDSSDKIDRTRENSLVVSSTSVDDQGRLSIDCTCDGRKQSPAVSWKSVPAGTKALAVSLWHTAPDQEKSYWLVYDIPAKCTGIGQQARPEGKVGLNDRRKAEYDPMCSKGPGVKTYHLTVYALSRPIDLAPEKVTRANFLQAIKEITLAEGTFDFQYERKGS